MPSTVRVPAIDTGPAIIPRKLVPWNGTIKRPPSSTRDEFFDKELDKYVIELKNDSGCFLDRDHGLETDSDVVERWAINRSDPLSATVDISWNQSFKRENLVVTTKSKLSVKCNADFFFINGSIWAYKNEKKVFKKVFNETVRREFV